MGSITGRFAAYLKYYWKAKTVYNIHSPFIYDFILDVMDTDKEYYMYPKLEALRTTLISDNNQVDYIDLGAGNRSGSRSISEIAKTSLSSLKQCRLLFNIVNKYKPRSIVELGTSLGLSTLYMASAFPNVKVHTIEGNPASAKIAQQAGIQIGAKNIDQHVGHFDEVLPNLLDSINTVDLAYIDGNHQEDATLKYFGQFKEVMGYDGIIIFDDIYWSKGMNRAWDRIKADKDVSLSIDLFELGIVFFNKSLTKTSVSLIEYFKKPWKIGIFG